MANHNNVLKIAQELKDKSIEARAYAGLGHAARCTGDIVQAKMWHEKQLDMALNTKDKVAEGRACSNLGMYLKFMYILWEGHLIWRNFPLSFYLTLVCTKRDISSNFVAFSENFNFNWE